MASVSKLKDNAISDSVWLEICLRTREAAEQEPMLASFLHATILNHDTFEAALSFHLANKLDSPMAQAMMVREVIDQAIAEDPSIATSAREDLIAVNTRDSACCSLATPFLYFKGFHALQCYRIAHWLWRKGRKPLALFLQNRISQVFAVDIHPAARIGRGVMLDHATGIVIGETAVVEDNVSIMQGVTLGGTGKESGDRHPKVRRGVLISAGATVLGNIDIGAGAKVAAGSVVLKPVAPHTTVAGVPAVTVGRCLSESPALDMDHELACRAECKSQSDG